VVQDHVEPDLMFLGSEFGVFFTVDGGERWTKLDGNTPNIAFRDLAIQTRENDLVGATFGRGIYVLDDYSPLRDVTQQMLASESALFPVRRVHWYVPKRPLACAEPGCVDSQGDAFFVAPNPPFGAVFTWYLPETLQTAKERRREDEKELEQDNRNVAFPSWERILEEELEDQPAIVFAVADQDGTTVRYIPGSAEAGFHRVAWDLRYPPLDPWLPAEERAMQYGRPTGVLAAPGTYRVDMYRRVDGEWTDMEQSQTFEVVSVREPTLPGSSQDERVAFDRQVDELRRAAEGSVSAIDRIVLELDTVKEVLQSSNAAPSLYTEANDIQQALKRARNRLVEHQAQQEFGVGGPMSVQSRLFHARYDPSANAYGPTGTQRESLNIARDLYAGVHSALSGLVDGRNESLQDALDRAGVPWTPGRGIQPAGRTSATP
jgi:hypothetical protein